MAACSTCQRIVLKVCGLVCSKYVQHQSLFTAGIPNCQHYIHPQGYHHVRHPANSEHSHSAALAASSFFSSATVAAPAARRGPLLPALGKQQQQRSATPRPSIQEEAQAGHVHFLFKREQQRQHKLADACTRQQQHLAYFPGELPLSLLLLLHDSFSHLLDHQHHSPRTSLLHITFLIMNIITLVFTTRLCPAALPHADA